MEPYSLRTDPVLGPFALTCNAANAKQHPNHTVDGNGTHRVGGVRLEEGYKIASRVLMQTYPRLRSRVEPAVAEVAAALVATLREHPGYLAELAVEKNWVAVSMDLIIDEDDFKPRLAELHFGCHPLVGKDFLVAPREVAAYTQGPLLVPLSDHLDQIREGGELHRHGAGPRAAACAEAIGARAIL